MLSQFEMKPGHHFRIKRGRYLRQRFNDREGKPTVPDKLLRHFEPDVTPTNDHHAADATFLNPRFDVLHIGNVAHREMPFSFNAGNRRQERR